jgi:hypothetical protein
MEPFIISFPEGSLLYRATNEENPSKGLWYTLDPADTYGYGKYTNQFITKAAHSLIDITQPNFYNNFINKLNELSLSNNFIKERKFDILFRKNITEGIQFCRLVKLLLKTKLTLR